MRKISKLAALLLISATVVVTLTSGGLKKEYSGGRNLVEELYDQAIKQNDNLEAMEEDIEKFRKKKSEALEKYNSYTAYNGRYYMDARDKVALIADAAIKQKANDQLSQSESAYNAKIAAWHAEIADMNAKERELSDLQILLKIITTRPMIEKYQSSEFPDNGKLKEAKAELMKVVERIRVITR